MATRDQVMSDFASRIGITPLEPDETGLCSLLIDNDFTAFIQLIGNDGLVMSAGIGIIPDESAAATCRALLESNNFWLGSGGFTLSLVPGSLQVLLSGRAEFANLSGDGLAEIFGRFVTTASDWRRRLPTIAEDSPSVQLAAADAEAAAQQERQETAFIRV